MLPRGYPSSAPAEMTVMMPREYGVARLVMQQRADALCAELAGAEMCYSAIQSLEDFAANLKSWKCSEPAGPPALFGPTARISTARPFAATAPVPSFAVERLGVASGGPKQLGFEAFLAESERALRATLRKQLPSTLATADGKRQRVVVEPVLEPDAFDRWAALTAANQRAVHRPLLTWHGSSLETVAKVAKYGYIKADDVNEATGELVPMKTGNLYGDGVYTSTMPSVAMWYGANDNDGSAMLLVNAVFLGRLYRIKGAGTEAYIKAKQVIRTVPNPRRKIEFHLDSETMTWQPKLPAGMTQRQFEELKRECFIYEPGSYDSIATHDLGIIVSTDATHVLPLFKVSFLPRVQQLIRHPAQQAQFGYRGGSVPCIKLARRLFAVELPHAAQQYPHGTSPTPVPPRHLVLVPTHGAPCIGRVGDSVAKFLGALGSAEDVWLGLYTGSTGGGEVQWHRVNDAWASKGLIAHSNRGSRGAAISSVAVALREAMRKARASASEAKTSSALENVAYVLVPPGAGLDGLAEVVAEYGIDHLAGTPQVQGAATANVTIKLIYLEHAPAETTVTGLAHAKWLLEAQSGWASLYARPYHCIPASGFSLDEIFDSLLDELETARMNRGSATDCRVDQPRVGEGFVTSLASHPQWQQLCSSKAVVCYGTAPEHIWFNRTPYTCTTVDPEQKQKNGGTPHQPQRVLAAVISLLNRLRTFMAGNKLRFIRHLRLALELARAALVLAETWTEHALDIMSQENLSQPCDLGLATSSELARRRSKSEALYASGVGASWTARVKQMKNVRRGMSQIAAILGEIETLGAISYISGKWFQRLQHMRFGKGLVRRAKLDSTTGAVMSGGVEGAVAAKQVAAELTKILAAECRADAAHLDDAVDALFVIPTSGFEVRLHRTAASEVEPWRLVVVMVSDKIVSFRELFARREFSHSDRNLHNAGATLKDCDMLPPGSGELPPTIWKMVHAYTFTRVPDAFLPTQPIALLVISWVSSVESLFKVCAVERSRNKELRPARTPSGGSFGEKVTRLAGLCSDLANRVITEYLHKWTFVQDLMAKLEEDSVEASLTEHSGALSVCMVLAALLGSRAKSLFVEPKKFSRLAFALMSEAVCRACRQEIRFGSMTPDWYIRGALQSRSGRLASSVSDLDLRRSTKATIKLFRNRKCTNCTAYAVVGCLEWIERFHEGKSPADIAEYFQSDKVGMGAFLRRHLGTNANGPLTQLALYCDGMKFYKSAMRQNLRFGDPQAAVARHVTEQNDLVSRKRAAMKRAKGNVLGRQARLLASATEYAAAHEIPVTFTEQEVHTLNAKRPADDQVHREPSGLLRHHCCYPSCPMFLSNFKTAADQENGTRFGLFGHLQPDQLTGNYAKGYHLHLQQVLRTISGSRVGTTPLAIQLANICQRVGGLELITTGTRKALSSHDHETRVICLDQILIGSGHVGCEGDGALGKDIVDLSEDVIALRATKAGRCKELEHARAEAHQLATISGGDGLNSFLQKLGALPSRDAPVFVLLQEELLRQVATHPDQTILAEKLFVCAVGHATLGSSTTLVWPAGGLAKPTELLRYAAKLRALDRKYFHLLQATIYAEVSKVPRHQYRRARRNRHGFSSTDPSFYALGFDTWQQFAGLVPRSVVDEYLDRHPSRGAR